ncbi:MAG: Terminase-like family protein [Gemmataceae bacterium]|nr:Terminase-like family protein [Gemmataceae bacterium]
MVALLTNRLRRRLESQDRRLAALEKGRVCKSPPFGPRWVQRYLPRYATSAPADFHGQLFDRLAEMHTRRGTKEAVIAPREGAKSTVVTLAYVLYCAVEKLEPFSLILSDSAGQATEKLIDLRRELEGNDALAADYSDACGVGPVWRNDRIELRNGCVIGAIGRKGRIRGRKNREARPSLIVFDDVENNTSIVSSADRTATWRWATREVIPAGRAGTNYLSVGSALHRECAAVKLGQLAGWSSRRYRAIHQWPTRMDLWEEWERLATNIANADREKTARAFYEANQEEMEAGAVTYWPERWPLYALMLRRAEIGAAAFTTEYQGVPSTEGLTEWPAEFFDDPKVWFDDWPAGILARTQSLDPSKGTGSKSSDFQAHVEAAFHRDGTVFIEGHLKKDQIAEMVSLSLDLATRPNPIPLSLLIVEDNDGLGMLEDEFQRQAAARKRLVPLKTMRNTENKIVRIRRLGVYFGRRQIRFRATAGTRLLVDQLRDFPHAEHDDGPDSLELCIRALELLAGPT